MKYHLWNEPIFEEEIPHLCPLPLANVEAKHLANAKHTLGTKQARLLRAIGNASNNSLRVVVSPVWV